MSELFHLLTTLSEARRDAVQLGEVGLAERLLRLSRPQADEPDHDEAWKRMVGLCESIVFAATVREAEHAPTPSD